MEVGTWVGFVALVISITALVHSHWADNRSRECEFRYKVYDRLGALALKIDEENKATQDLLNRIRKERGVAESMSIRDALTRLSKTRSRFTSSCFGSIKLHSPRANCRNCRRARRPSKTTMRVCMARTELRRVISEEDASSVRAIYAGSLERYAGIGGRGHRKNSW